MSEHEIDLAGLRAAADLAYDEVIRLCQPGSTWRMSIPANESCDSDLLISKVLAQIPDLIERVEAAEGALAVSGGPRSAARVEGGSECHCGAAGAGEGGAL